MPPEQTPQKESSQTQEQHNLHIQTLRTYRGDMEETIHAQKESVVTIVAKEQERKAEQPIVEQQPRKQSSHFLATFSLLLLLVLISLGGFIYTQTKLNTTTSTQTTSSILPSAQQMEVLVGTNPQTDIKRAITNTISSFRGSPRETMNLSLVQGSSTVDTRAFMALLAPHAQDALGRNVTNYMIGIYSELQNKPFVIIKTDDYGIAYKEMLTWESYMYADMKDIFPNLDDAVFTDGRTIFTDDTFKNKDVRVLSDNNKNTVLIYGFLDKNTLVITTDIDTFTGVLGLYINSQLRK
jgi:hypothetical protein